MAEGEREQVQKLVKYLRMGPPAAIVRRMATEWSEYTGYYSNFRVIY
jgi:acylphosphatase